MFRDTSLKFQLFSLTLSYIYALSIFTGQGGIMNVLAIQWVWVVGNISCACAPRRGIVLVRMTIVVLCFK